MNDLEIDGLHFQWIESKAQISCAVITQLICTFALHKAGFLMMWLMFLVVILLLFLVGKKSYFITVIMVDKKYCQLIPYFHFYSFYFQFSSSSLQEGSAKMYHLTVKATRKPVNIYM